MNKTAIIAIAALAAAPLTAAAQVADETRWAQPEGAEAAAKGIEAARLDAAPAVAALAAAPAPAETPATLLQRHRADLESLYKTLAPGEIPNGESDGLASSDPGTAVGGVSEAVFALFWKGKVFDRTKGQLINRVLGMHLVTAQVFYGPSWLDGKTSIIIDYAKTSHIAGFIRDEIRETSPGVYLGFAYTRAPEGGTPNAPLLFALNFNKTTAAPK